jgi:dTDP-glucose 4,6-dehydratase
MHVTDVCRAIKLVLEEGPTNEIINIGSGIPQRFKPLMEYVKKQVGSDSVLENVEPPHFHKTVQVKDMYLDVQKLKGLGFEQNLPIYRGIDRVIEAENCDR